MHGRFRWRLTLSLMGAPLIVTRMHWGRLRYLHRVRFLHARPGHVSSS
jgi:hypothetical protein